MLLRVDDLRVTYHGPAGDVPAVRGVSLRLAAGDCVGVIGESGCGKSTVGRALLGLLPPGTARSGRIELDGTELTSLREQQLRRLRGRRIAVVPQGAMSALNPVLRIGDQLAEPLLVHHGLAKGATQGRVAELLEQVGLGTAVARRYPHELSGGMRQRAVIAAALAAGPAMLVADEPTTGLDVVAQAEVLALLTRLRTELGLGLLFISHDVRAVLACADRVVVMYAGIEVETAPAHELATRPRHPYTAGLLAALPPLHATRTAAVTRTEGNPPAHGQPPLLDLRDLVVRYGGRRRLGGRGQPVIAVDGVNLAVAGTEIVGLVGRSGSGKTTIARVVLRLTEPSSGAVRFAGRDILALRGRELREHRRRVALVHQDSYGSLHPAMAVADLVSEPLLIAGRPTERRARVREVLAAVGLEPTPGLLAARAGQLSGGQRQRVALARALAAQPGLLIADEPTSMLDASVRAGVAATLAELATAFGLAVLLITHDLAEAASLCDRLCVLAEGRQVEQGATEQVLTAPVHPETVRLIQAAELGRPRPRGPTQLR